MKLTLSLATVLAVLPMKISLADYHIPTAVVDSAKRLVPDFAAGDVAPSPVPGLYRLRFGANVVYMSADGFYVMRGDLIDVRSGANLTEDERRQIRGEAVEDLGEESMIVFAPGDEVKATITVFTDITCPYCAKLHNEVAQLNNNGIKVRYLAFPRAGVPSSVADDMISVWCADDPKQAITDAKAGLPVADRQCPNPVKEHYEMGVQVGVRGTPTIVLEDGSTLGGYVPHRALTDSAMKARRRLADR